MIVAAAILHEGIIYTGVRHCEIIQDIIKLGGTPPIKNNEQGFIDDKNNFMYRHQSLDHAIDCGQIGFKEDGSYDIIGGVLTSEDLWKG